MARLGCLLMILSIVALFAIIVIPVLPFLEDNDSIDTMLQALLCQPGEQVIREQYSRRDSDGTAYSMDVYCMGRDEVRQDVTGRWALLGGLGFTIPFLLGMAGLMLGMSRFARKRAASFTTAPVVMSGGTISPVRPASGSDQTLTQRLQELEKARSTGLITDEEFERMRKDVLDEGV